MHSTIQNLRSVFPGQYWPPSRIRGLQERKLTRLVRHAYATVPYYRRLFDKAGVAPEAVRKIEDLARIPVTTKAMLLQSDPADLISSRYAKDRLQPDCGSGTSGEPITLYFDKGYVFNRNLRFLRGLGAAGYRPGQRLLLITDRQDSKGKGWMRWKHVSLEASPDRLLESIEAYRPDVLYGGGTPLRQIAEHILATGHTIRFPLTVVWTAESLDGASRRLVEQAFRTRVFDFYGLTEMGLVGWECQAHAGYHLSEDSLVVEHVPVGNNPDIKRMVMTNLDLYSMPLIRYDTGDLGIPSRESACSCGRKLAKLARVDGRVIDTIKLRSGASISPYSFICRLELLERLARFQVVQDNYEHITIYTQSAQEDRSRLDASIRGALREVVADDIELEIRHCDRLEDNEPGKFRSVQSLIGRQT